MSQMSPHAANAPWVYPITLTSDSHTVVFQTANTFLDANIKAEISVDAGSVSPIITTSNFNTYFNSGTAQSNSISIIPKATTTAGFISEYDNSHAVTGTTEYYTIKTASPGADNSSADVTLYTTDGTNNGINISSIVGTKATAEPTSGYYLAFKGSGRSKITTAGWITEGNLNTSTSDPKYFPITAAAITASCTNATATTTVAPGTVTIAKNGTTNVNNKTQILATVDPTTATSGISTYFIAIKANAAANSTGATSSISGTNTASVSTAGYAPTTLTGTGTISGTATAKTSEKDSLVYYIPVPTAGYNSNSASAEITKTDTDNSSTGGVNVGGILGARATAEPTSGYYISLQASGSGSSKITTAGWLPANQELTEASTTVERFFPVTAANVTVSKTDGSITPSASLSKSDSVTWSTSDTSGVWLKATGNGSVSNLSIKANVSTAGYVPEGDIDTASNLSIAAASTAATETKYITGVTIASGKSFTVSSAGTLGVTLTGGTTTVTSAVSNTAGTVKISAKATASSSSLTTQNVVTDGHWVYSTVGNSSNSTYTTKYGITVVKYGTVSTNFDNSNLLTYFTNDGTSSDYSISITPRYTVSKAGYLAAVTNTAGTIAYYKIRTTSITQGTTTVSGTTATRGTATWGDGWISNGSLGAAAFGNAPATGKTEDSYVNISSTTAAPVLVSGGFLYINRGYVDDLKISLAKLIPDTMGTGETGFAAASYILQGYVAFNGSGERITGTIPTYNGAYEVTEN